MLVLQRDIPFANGVFGELFLNNSHYGYTLERSLTVEHPRIPAGTYGLIVDWSNEFKKNMLHLLDVPGRAGIRIHGGNTVDDSKGCILLGAVRFPLISRIANCKLLVDQLVDYVDRNHNLTIVVKEK